ncbi:MAG: DUF541 domain-containing protein [Candidatus Portnoybacteria bacterium]|nr:DUF541 domain-containing protein [Candidatus Portnoybacteria bacterium]
MLGIFKKQKLLISLIGIIIALLLLSLLIYTIVGIINKSKQTKYIGADAAFKNTINIQGEGRTYGKPDIATMNLSVVTEGKDIEATQEENTEKMNNVISFLKDFGIEETDIKTTNYRLNPVYSYEDKRIPQIIGYEISQTLETKIRDISKTGEILKNSVGVGINRINSLRFEIEEENDLKQEARRLAIKDAKEKAKKLAEQLGVDLLKISGFTENTSFDYPVYREMGIGGAGDSPQIQTGENEIVVRVTLIYEIN